MKRPAVITEVLRPDLIHVGGFTALAFDRVGSRHHDPSTISEGTLLYMSSWEMWRAHRDALPPHRLLTVYHDSQISGRTAEAMLDDPNLLAWHGVNAMTIHPKLSPIPLGFRKLPRLPLVEDVPRSILCYVNLRTHQMPERQRLYDTFANHVWVTVAERTDPISYLRDLHRSWIVPSPPGHGPDCYRTWEALIMGAIPVVRHSVLDALYTDLPVWLIESWDEITEASCWETVARMAQLRLEHGFRLEKLTMAYWASQLQRTETV